METMINAKDALMYQRYVHDLLSGDDTAEDQEDQIELVESLLASNRFKLKFITCCYHGRCQECDVRSCGLKTSLCFKNGVVL